MWIMQRGGTTHTHEHTGLLRKAFSGKLMANYTPIESFLYAICAINPIQLLRFYSRGHKKVYISFSKKDCNVT